MPTVMNPVIHFEMPAKDNQRVAEFYSKVFGWKTQILGPEEIPGIGRYVSFRDSEGNEVGMLQPAPMK